MKTTLFGAALLMLFAAGAAIAGEGARPCIADIEKFCKDVKPGGGRIADCLKAHEAELSADCKTKEAEPTDKARGKGGRKGRAMGPMDEACKADFEKFCKDEKGGPSEKMACMKEHEKDFSETCKAKLAEGKQKFEKRHPCAAEMQKLCAGMKPGDGKFAACMKEHEKDLSDTCKADFAKRKEEMQKKNPCAADMEKFCKDVKPGEGRIMECMKTHETELSEGCKTMQAEGKGRMGKGGEGRRRGMDDGKPGDKPGPGDEDKPGDEPPPPDEPAAD